MATTPQYNFNVNRQDLDFILKQIKIAEDVTNLNPASVDDERAAFVNAIGGPGAQVSSVAMLPYGLRTVDGTWNNLLPGQERAGSADNLMPRLVPIDLNQAGSGSLDFDGPGGAPAVVGSTTNYSQFNGFVVDAQPRVISNLIVDQTANNPAALQAATEAAADGVLGVTPTFANGSLSIPNISPDIGLSPPFNTFMTFFGQFFDHGLDLIDKGGSGTVFVPLLPDDPLFVPGGSSNFMVLGRATNQRGTDGLLGTADDIHDHRNTTTPFVDQNQTYTSHPSHQVFLRQYARVGDNTVDVNPNLAGIQGDAGTALDVAATGRLLTGLHGEGNWGEVKTQARDVLGIRLQDSDIFDVPLLATDRYGEFIRGPNGFVQVVTSGGLLEGDPTANGGLGVFLPTTVVSPTGVVTGTVRTGHAFLNDIAHNATPSAGLTPDADLLAGQPNPAFNPALPVGGVNFPFLPQPAGTYDNETLDRHFITGDGRGNENIGLTTVHSIFHSEHNRLVEDNKLTIISSGDRAFAAEWVRNPASLPAVLPTTPAGIDALIATLNTANAWDGERLFQAGRFVTEMQYQHLVFEEFARAVSPTIDPFVFSNSPTINPLIVAEFANVVYRFGHSMLTETVARTAADGTTTSDIGLIQAFLNPLEFDKNGSLTEAQAIGQIVRGSTAQVGNAIDEFVVEALRNNLVGLPLDLAVLNMARARDTGMPSYNEARAQFYAASGDAQLKPFTSWADMAPNLKHSASIINFIAAYGTHPSITGATTLADKRAAATLLVMDNPGDLNPANVTIGATTYTDRLSFLNSTGTWATNETGLNNVDLWIGGLAEFVNEFQGMLGPTFNYVFENQLENLQNGDRFYYLSRTQGTNMLNQLENNTFSKLIMRNSDLGVDSTHLSSLVFATPNYALELSGRQQRYGAGPDGVLGDDPLTVGINEALDDTLDPKGTDPVLEAINPMVQRAAGFLKFSGGEHVTLGGTAGADTLQGGRGIDSLWGDGGNDHLDGGDEADQVHGGDGDDIITDHGTPAGGADFLHGDNGNDVISAGTGNDLLFGGLGNDFIILGNDFSEVFAGEGNDFLLGGNGPDTLMGNEGNDWIEGGEGFDGLAGENSELFFNSPIIGHDVLNGQGNDTDYDGESGDDIMVEGPGIQRNNGMLGFDWAIHKGDPVAADSDLAIPFFPAQTVFTLRDRFDSVEALSGWRLNDHLVGTSAPTGAVGGGAGGIFGAPATDSMLLQKNVGLVSGLQNLLGVLPVANPEAFVFNPQLGADIIIGGAGSDLIEGKAGNDLIDGDSWMNVRIGISGTTNPVPTSAESMNDIRALMLAGTINPGQLSIVREIVSTGVLGSDVDIAVYNGPSTDYTITNATDAFGQRVVRITDNVIAPVVIDGVVVPLLDDEGTDTLRNVEIARFITRDANGVFVSQEEVVISSRGPTGTATLSEATAVTAAGPNLRNGVPLTPTEGQALNSTLSVITDPDNVTIANPTGAVAAGAITRVWQSSVDGVTWTDVGTGASFTPPAGLVNPLNNGASVMLRVEARFTDGAGFAESIASDPTGFVGDNFAGTANVDLFLGTAGDDVANGGGSGDALVGGTGNDVLNGDAGVDILDGGDGDDRLNGGAGNDNMTGGAGNDTFVENAAGDVMVEAVGGGIDTVLTTAATSTLDANVENLTFTGAGNFVGIGNLLDNVMIGGTGDDDLTGGAGVDRMTGGGGNDFFIFDDGDTGVGAARDIITDFLGGAGAQSDDIRLGLVDANSGVAADQAFTFIGTAAFSAVAQLRAVLFDSDGNGSLESTLIQGNTTGATGAELEILLLNYTTPVLLGTDFQL